MLTECPDCGNHDTIYLRTTRLVCRKCAEGKR